MIDVLKKCWIIFIAAFFLAAENCHYNRLSDQDIEAKALKITRTLSDSSIALFKKWDYNTRGNYGFWSNTSRSERYTCIYIKNGDTICLRIFQLQNFLKDFPCNCSFDTLNYNRFDFIKYKNEGGEIKYRIKAVDSIGREQLLDNNMTYHIFFYKKDPYKTFAGLTSLKDSLALFGTFYRRDIGDFVEFYLSPQYILTYLPDNPIMNPNFRDIWFKEFATGKTIKKNWNLRKAGNPRDE